MTFYPPALRQEPLRALKLQRRHDASKTAEGIRTKRIYEQVIVRGADEFDVPVECVARNQLPRNRIEDFNGGVQESIHVHIRIQRHLAAKSSNATKRRERRWRTHKRDPEQPVRILVDGQYSRVCRHVERGCWISVRVWPERLGVAFDASLLLSVASVTDKAVAVDGRTPDIQVIVRSSQYAYRLQSHSGWRGSRLRNPNACLDGSIRPKDLDGRIPGIGANCGLNRDPAREDHRVSCLNGHTDLIQTGLCPRGQRVESQGIDDVQNIAVPDFHQQRRGGCKFARTTSDSTE